MNFEKKIELSPGPIESKMLKEKMDLDRERLRLEYLNAGFFKVQVTKPTIEKKQPSRLTIIFNIDEGSKYLTRNIQFEGDLILSEPQLKSLVTLRKTEPYSFKKIETSLEALNQAYQAAGDPYVDIIPQVTADESKKVIDTIFVIKKGENRP